MHQSFLTSDTLYVMVFDASRPRPDEANAEAVQREMEEKLTRWAALVSACAPGMATALLRYPALIPIPLIQIPLAVRTVLLLPVLLLYCVVLSSTAALTLIT